MTYTISTRFDADFDTVIDATTEALSDEGFGVITDVDFQATIDEKLGEEMQQYRVLGACDPGTAFEGIEMEPELGALLPCNVAVHEDEDGMVVVSAVDPVELIGLTGNDELEAKASDIAARIETAVESIDA